MFVTREVGLRHAAAVVGRIGVLTVGCSLWWIAGLCGPGRLRHRRPPVHRDRRDGRARRPSAPEVLRGLGYWFFYGEDRFGPWIARVEGVHPAGLAARRHLPAADPRRWSVPRSPGSASARSSRRWSSSARCSRSAATRGPTRRSSDAASRHSCVPTPASPCAACPRRAARSCSAWRCSSAAASPRSPRTTSAGPGPARRGVSWSWRVARPAAAVDRPDGRQEPRPRRGHPRLLEAGRRATSTAAATTPGSSRCRAVDFASYRWGTTVDPITPGLMDRPYVARELIPYGSPPSADLLNAFDRQMQESVLDPRSRGPGRPG